MPKRFPSLGNTLEDHGSSRMGTRWSRTGFSLILDRFWNPILKAFWAPGLEIPICSGLFPGHFLIDLKTEISTRGTPHARFRTESIAKKNCSNKLFLWILNMIDMLRGSGLTPPPHGEGPASPLWCGGGVPPPPCGVSGGGAPRPHVPPLFLEGRNL